MSQNYYKGINIFPVTFSSCSEAYLTRFVVKTQHLINHTDMHSNVQADPHSLLAYQGCIKFASLLLRVW